MRAALLPVILGRPQPRRIPTHRATLSTTTDENTTVFAGVDIGIPHTKRIVVLGVYGGVAAAQTNTVNGIAPYATAQNATHEYGVFAFQVPLGKTASISITAASSVRKAVVVYTAYPATHTVVDQGTATASGTTDATPGSKNVTAGGFVVYMGGQSGASGPFATTWSGAESVTEIVDANLETGSYTSGLIYPILATGTGTITMAETISSVKRLAMFSIGPA